MNANPVEVNNSFFGRALGRKQKTVCIDKLELLQSNSRSDKPSLWDSDANFTAETELTSSLSSLSFAPKAVRFATDKNGDVLCKTHSMKGRRTKKEAAACWYTMEQFKQFRVDCKKEAILQQKTSYRENFAKVYQACKTGKFKNVTKERAYVSAASCRGLEAVVYSTLQGDRKNALSTVLKTQEAVPKDMSVEKKQEMIASASRFMTKQARQLARVLGSGDAAVVVANNRIAAHGGQAVPQAYTH